MVSLTEERKPDRRVVFVIFAACSIGLLFSVYSVLPVWSLPLSPSTLPILRKPDSPYVDARIGPHWHGWKSIRQLVVFGDSWSSTGFELDGGAPSGSNPFGNPAWPGHTVTNGANWAEYLTEKFNESVVYAADFAVGGATVDSKLIKPGVPESFLRSLKVQVEEEWENYHKLNYTADTSLFSIWVGVNDITAYTAETRGNFGKEFVVFDDLLNKLYHGGARNFIMFNAPPLERAPIAQTSDPNGDWVQVIDEWNANLTTLVQDFRLKYNDTTTFFFDVWKLFDVVMREPCTFAETCNFKVTTDSCDKYMFGTIEPDYHDPACPYAVDEYFWINALHPSTQTHNMTAKAVYDALTGGDADERG